MEFEKNVKRWSRAIEKKTVKQLNHPTGKPSGLSTNLQLHLVRHSDRRYSQAKITKKS